MDSNQYRILQLKLHQHDYEMQLKLHNDVSDANKMTVLLFAKDYIKNKLNLPEISFNFDELNPTNEEEILQEALMESVLIKYKKPENIEEFKLDGLDREVIYVNNKNQLIKITPVERNGKQIEMHQIISFSVTSLPQASTHKYGIEDSNNGGSTTPKFSKAPAQRVKVPVKDGQSQGSQRFAGLVQNPNEIFYTPEQVAEHTSEDDCWTVFNGKVYDITQYAKVHPGGRKIFLGKGKDCTELFNKYHPWVNTQFLIGKYQVGIFKRE